MMGPCTAQDGADFLVAETADGKLDLKDCFVYDTSKKIQSVH